MRDLRYVTSRRRRDGTVRALYWQRRGHPLTRLDKKWPDAWESVVTRLNRMADLGTVEANPAAPPEGTVARVIYEYRESDEWRVLSESTRKIYGRWLNEFESMWGDLPPRALTRRVCIDFKRSIKSAYVRVQAVAVLQNVLNMAIYLGDITDNPAKKMRVGKPAPRRQRWPAEQFDAFIKACEGIADGEGLALGMLLLLYTGQRPGDALGTRAGAEYDGETITVVQQKTRATVEIKVHRDLKAALDRSLEARPRIYLAARDDGSAFSDWEFRSRSRELRLALGLHHLQNRDLRREAVCRLFEAGCTTGQIASITGHTLRSVERILEVYFVRSAELARQAITRWENAGGTEKSNTLE